MKLKWSTNSKRSLEVQHTQFNKRIWLPRGWSRYWKRRSPHNGIRARALMRTSPISRSICTPAHSDVGCTPRRCWGKNLESHYGKIFIYQLSSVNMSAGMLHANPTRAPLEMPEHGNMLILKTAMWKVRFWSMSRSSVFWPQHHMQNGLWAIK